MVIPCLYLLLFTALRTLAAELPVNKKRTRTLSHRELGSSTNEILAIPVDVPRLPQPRTKKQSTGLFFAPPAAGPCFRVLYRPPNRSHPGRHS